MSLLDCDLDKLDDLVISYDDFVKYLQNHCPHALWNKTSSWNYKQVSYIRITDGYRVDNQTRSKNEYEGHPMKLGIKTDAFHSTIEIIPTDDGGVELNANKHSSFTFPIITTEEVPPAILNALEPIKDRLEIIYGVL